MTNSTMTRRLFFRVTPTVLITIGLIGALAFRSTTQEINRVYDAQLVTNTNVLWMLIAHELTDGDNHLKTIDEKDSEAGEAPDEDDNTEALNEYADARMFRIWRNGKIVMYSDTGLPASVPKQQSGLSDLEYQQEHWRIFSRPLPHTNVTIEVGEKISLRETLVDNILLDVVFPLLVLVPIIGALIWLGITNGLGTIRTLVAEIRSRSPDDLSPISLLSLPRDLTPLGKSINQLLAKLENSFIAERRFADHAAHQLRTPLARFKLQLQMLADADSEEERQSLIHGLLGSNEQATHLVEQLLRAARVSHQPIQLQPVNLYDAAQETLTEMHTLSAQKQLTIELKGSPDAEIQADDALLGLMLSNLVENAVKYTPEGGAIRLHIDDAEDAYQLTIEDSGPGIAESEREAVFHRFYRSESAPNDGAGLGLAIVADIIARFNGSITLSTASSGSGLRVEVIIPKAVTD